MAGSTPISSHDLLPRAVGALAITLVVMGALIFVPAGTLRYWEAWVYCAVFFVPTVLATAYFYRKDPALIARRMRMREPERAQRWIIALGGVVWCSGLVAPGLDHRFGWSHVPAWLALVADAIVLASYGGMAWVLDVNPWAARTIDVEPGQRVIRTGPYAIVRHPMYAAGLPMICLTPLALGSYWGIPPVLLSIPIFVMRILNEEAVLRARLPGYDEYCEAVPYRLIPGIW